MENSESQQVIQKIIEWVESSKDFVKGEFPDFVAQYMRAALIRTWIDFSILLIAFICLALIAFYHYKWSYTHPEKFKDSFFAPLFLILSSVGMFPIFVGLINELHNLINIYVAPKAYMLCNLKQFLK